MARYARTLRNWKTVYSNFVHWRKDGTFERVLKHLRMKLNEEELLGYRIFGVDSSTVKTAKAAVGAKKKGLVPKRVRSSRRLDTPLTTKMHLICDGNGLPLAVVLSGGTNPIAVTLLLYWMQ